MSADFIQDCNFLLLLFIHSFAALLENDQSKLSDHFVSLPGYASTCATLQSAWVVGESGAVCATYGHSLP